MHNQKPQILVTRRLPEIIEARMAALFDTHVNQADTILSGDKILAGLANKDALVSTITDRIDATLVERLPASVRLIAQFGNGGDNIDVEAAERTSITVTNTPHVLTDDTADMAIAANAGSAPATGGRHADAAKRPNLGGLVANISAGSPPARQGSGYCWHGRISTAVAQRARAFGLIYPLFFPQSSTSRHRGTAGSTILE